jgi:uncharacterized protein YjiS (DUF1127 family)
MSLKFKIAVARQRAPAKQVWPAILAFVRAHRQRARDRRILSHMNDHHLRDIGLSHSVSAPRDRAHWPGTGIIP